MKNCDFCSMNSYSLQELSYVRLNCDSPHCGFSSLMTDGSHCGLPKNGKNYFYSNGSGFPSFCHCCDSGLHFYST
jgi:hypothetical protein